MSQLEEIVRDIAQADSCEPGSVIQSLWSGYGVIQRFILGGSEFPSAIVKHIDVSRARTNARGWSGDLSHQRKVRSYQIEKAFYETFARRCSDRCRIPDLIGAVELDDRSGWVIVLADLDAVGFGVRKNRVDQGDVLSCLSWLANFHATFMACDPIGLWPVGTYWHLETRPDEWKAMPDGLLKQLAPNIDARLNNARFQTLVHGDAKLANFCFGQSKNSGVVRVAALDFQYVGGGCGMKDVAYFLSSCLSGGEAEEQEAIFLDHYFAELKQCLSEKQLEAEIVQEVEREWRELYAFAWADFCRFLSGWSPNHWKMNRYSNRLTNSIIESLKN